MTTCSPKPHLSSSCGFWGKRATLRKRRNCSKPTLRGSFHHERFPKKQALKEEKPLETDYVKIGLKVGIEIHQQLATSQKLFCGCPPELFKEKPEITFLRRLRPTQSELGQVDPAAYFEFQKGIKIRYEANRTTSCLVEMDEEPPHPLNMEAVEVVLTAALMMNAKPVDEVHVMRKTVIDGSNTTGFQRTCAIALDGWINVGRQESFRFSTRVWRRMRHGKRATKKAARLFVTGLTGLGFR